MVSYIKVPIKTGLTVHIYGKSTIIMAFFILFYWADNEFIKEITGNNTECLIVDHGV